MSLSGVLKGTKETFVRERSATSSESGNESSGSTDNHIFADPTVADYWRKVYEKAQYENRHRFDPTYTWSAEEEGKLVRKVLTATLRGEATTNSYADRLAYYSLGLGHVLLPRLPSSQHQSRHLRQHGKFTNQ